MTGQRGLLTNAESLAARSTALCIWFQPWRGLIQIWLCAKASSSCDASSYSISSRFLRMLSLAPSNSLVTLPITPIKPSALAAPLKHSCEGGGPLPPWPRTVEGAHLKEATLDPLVDKTVGHSKVDSSDMLSNFPALLPPRLPSGILPRRSAQRISPVECEGHGPRCPTSISTPSSSPVALRLLTPATQSPSHLPSTSRALSWTTPSCPCVPVICAWLSPAPPARPMDDFVPSLNGPGPYPDNGLAHH